MELAIDPQTQDLKDSSHILNIPIYCIVQKAAAMSVQTALGLINFLHAMHAMKRINAQPTAGDILDEEHRQQPPVNNNVPVDPLQ